MADVRDEVTGPAQWRGIGFSSAVKTASVSREHLNHLNHVDSDRPFCSSITLQTPYKMTTTDTIPPPTDAQPHPHEISFPLPKALHTTAHIHLTRLDTCTTVFLATSTPGDSGGTMKPMGSFVYAMPDRTNPRTAISTTLYTSPTVEYTTRVAKILARRTRAPVYVGCSIDPTALSLTVEEEMEGLTKIVDTVLQRWEGK